MGGTGDTVTNRFGREFFKMTGSGNDFVFFDARDEATGDRGKPEEIRRLCARGTGVGADGVIAIVADRAGGQRETSKVDRVQAEQRVIADGGVTDGRSSGSAADDNAALCRIRYSDIVDGGGNVVNVQRSQKSGLSRV